MLVITADESDSSATACCSERPGPNVTKPGITGPGGGRIGALVLSPYVAPGTHTDTAYNHYSLLATIEDLFGLSRLGYARTTPATFGADVFTAS
jgi:phosphatidylinositol-3-phosphatase